VVSGKPLEEGMHPYPLKQPPAVAPHNHLYRNNGDGTFTDVTGQAGVAANIYGMAAIAADFDNDGFVDLFVTGYGRAILYRNNGNGTFTDVTGRPALRLTAGRSAPRGLTTIVTAASTYSLAGM